MSRTVGFFVVFWVAFLTWVVWGVVAVHSIERPGYVVTQHHNGYEVRQYAPYLVAQIPVKGPWSYALAEGTRRISEYLAGANTTQSSVAVTLPVGIQPRPQSEYMAPTAPVVQETKDNYFLVSLILPSRYALDTMPLPDNPEIRLVQVASVTAAVMTFNGTADQEKVNTNSEHLRTLLENDKRTILSPARLAHYNAPWAPVFLSQNEIIFTVR